MAKWYESKSATPLAIVNERAEKLTGKPAVCSRCRFFTLVTKATGVGTCRQRPGEPQFQFGVCLSWEAIQKPAEAPPLVRPVIRASSPTKSLQGAPEPVSPPLRRPSPKPR